MMNCINSEFKNEIRFKEDLSTLLKIQSGVQSGVTLKEVFLDIRSTMKIEVYGKFFWTREISSRHESIQNMMVKSWKLFI